jgi:plasmid rolling circle replication initiator protein Rep
MDLGRRVKKIFQSKPKGSIMRRPKLRWLKDEGKDLWQMKIKRWRQKAVDREELASIIMKTKFIRGP